jgi:hypothetical protein
MNHTVKLVMAATLVFAFCACTTAAAEDLANGFAAPAESVRPWCYWWWLNGYVTKEGIVRDLDEMRAKGINGVLVFHAGAGPTPKRTEFMSPEWRTLFRFAVEEAARRTMVVGLNLCDGWNAGGPWVKPEDAAKTLVYSTMGVTGPKNFSGTLPKADKADKTYRDTMVLAWQIGGPSSENRKSTCLSQTWVDLTAKMSSDGRFAWQAPTGEWLIVRFGYQTQAHTKCTGGGSYWEIDPLSAEALDRHFAATAGVLLQDVKPYVGKTWKYVHIDSGEIGNPEWTPKLGADFRRLRGYDPLPYFAAKAGQIVDDPAITERFLEDYDRTIGDLMIEGYYGHLGQLARQHGLGTHSEAAGYQKPTVDALRSMGCNDIAMSEFWSRQSPSETNLYIHQLAAAQLRYHDGIKNAASAAHIYGRKIAQAEAFTVIRDLTARPHGAYPNWDGDLFALKAIGDRAFCAGANRMVLCHFIHQPEPDDQAPGYVWPGVGVEFSRKITWWPLIHGWLSYMTRCQRLLQEGRFVADVCYFQGEWVPAYVPAKWAMNPPLPPGFDCDMINAEALVTRSAAGQHRRLVLPDGQSYRYLVLWQGGRWQHPPPQVFNKASDPSTRATCPAAGSARPLALSPATLKKLKELVEGGVTLVGPRPDRAIGLAGYPTSDVEVKKLTDELWGAESAPAGQRKVSKGRVIWGQSLAQVMQADGLRPDLEIVEDPATAALPTQTLSGIPNPGSFDCIHRTLDNAEVYFIANLRNAEAAGKFTFRVDGKQPELWDPLTGAIRDAAAFQAAAGRTTVPLEFAPRGSLFVVLRKPIAADAAGNAKSNFPKPSAFQEITGAWTVRFDPKWGGPASVEFARLEDWTKRPEPGINYYSGKATYMKTFDVPASACQPGKRLWLDLGKVKNVAEVRLNSRSFGGVWTAPWRVELTGVVRPSGNRLEIDVANLWPNRLIGDAKLPPEKRLTKANVAFKPDQSLLESGLLGPVTLQADTTTIPDKP